MASASASASASSYHGMRRSCPPGTRIANVRRRYHSATPYRYPYKGENEKRDSINTESHEYSKSGSDSQAAQKRVSFDPSVTKPGEEERRADSKVRSPLFSIPIPLPTLPFLLRLDLFLILHLHVADNTLCLQSDDHPLDVSPASRYGNEPKTNASTAESSPSESSDAQSGRKRTSGGGSAPKSGS